MKLISAQLLEELAAAAAASPRGRTHYNLHASAADLVQRYLVVANRGSYFRPHRHTTRAELALIVRGGLDLIVFDDARRVSARYAFGAGAGNIAYENGPGVWHTVIVQADATTFLEVKQGPYDPATASEFAPWAPAEGEAAAARFLEWAGSAVPGDRVPA
ncbi:MAG TPA: WbuC family cupin fold metalloprotein [Steroidobacteraceae bacterium]|nr:WbuC family cupin fold metalloprotein [Steroidobacteraceae bacterium]